MTLLPLFEPSRWAPKRDESILEYWTSLSPVAPLFGVAWRFGDAGPAPKPAATTRVPSGFGKPVAAVAAAAAVPAPAAAAPVVKPAPTAAAPAPAEPAVKPAPAAVAPAAAAPAVKPAPAAVASAPAAPVVKPAPAAVAPAPAEPVRELAGPSATKLRMAEPAPEVLPSPAASAGPVAAALAEALPEGPAAGEPVIEGGVRPESLMTSEPANKDDLKLIKGVGPKLERELNALGIYRFSQIAGFSLANLAWVDGRLTVFKGRPFRDNWIDQAAALARR